MKKTVIALAIAAMAATSANAATVYDKDGTKVELNGSLRMFLGKLGHNQRGDLVDDGSRIVLKGSHKLNDDVSVFAGYQLRFQNKDEKTTKSNQGGTDTSFGGIQTRDLLVGFKFNNVGSVSFGRQATNADDVLGDSLYYGSAGLSDLTTHADKSIKFKSAEFGGFSFGLDYMFGHAKKYDSKTSLVLEKDKTTGVISPKEVTTDGNTYKNGYAATVFYNYEFAEGHSVDAALTYGVDQYDDRTTSSTVKKAHKWLFATHYDIEGLHLGAAYGQYYDSYKGSTENEKSHYVFAESVYDLEKVANVPSAVGLQWERLSSRGVNKATGSLIKNRYIAMVDYKFTKNVVPYVEYIRATTKQNDTKTKENIYGVGLRVHF